jgi:hypothetical protein
MRTNQGEQMEDGLFGISIEQQIEEVEREIRMREHCYPRWIQDKRMLEKHADKYLSRMRAVLATLKSTQLK